MSDKEDTLAKLEAKMAAEHSTPLSKNTNNLVFGVGHPDANLMLVGEGPGEYEDKQGEPFVGKAGKFLDALMERAEIKREEVYITNTVKYRPPRNRTPTNREANLAEPYLHAQIAIIEPNALVSVGQFASARLTGMDASLQYLRGNWWPFQLDSDEEIPVRPVYHPGFLLRQDKEEVKSYCKETVEEFLEARRVAEGEKEARFMGDQTREVDTGEVLNSVDATEIEFD